MIRILLTILAVLYALSPFDAWPDFIWGWGWIDDILLLWALWRTFYRGSGSANPFTAFRRSARTAGNRFGTGSSANAAGGARGRHGDRRAAGPPDPWQVLGVPRDASIPEIKSAFRRLAQQHHPDKLAHEGPQKQKEAEARFKEVQAAYQELMHRHRR